MRPVFEVNVVDVQGGGGAGVHVVRRRQSPAQSSSGTTRSTTRRDRAIRPFQGEITATDLRAAAPLHGRRGHPVDHRRRQRCGRHQRHRRQPYSFGGSVVASSDTATSPEAAVYSPAGRRAGGRLQRRGLPVPDPDRAVHRTRQLRRHVHRERGQAQPVRLPAELGVLPGQPAAELRPGDDDRTTAGSAAGSAGRRRSRCRAATNPPSPLNNLAARGPVGLRLPHEHAHLHHRGQRGLDRRGVAQPADPGRARRSGRSSPTGPTSRRSRTRGTTAGATRPRWCRAATTSSPR